MKKRLKQTNRVLFALLLLGVYAIACASVCFAAPLGSLTLNCVFHKSSGDVALAGDTYAIALIAEATTDEDGAVRSFHTLEAYAEWDCLWSAQPASVLAKTARELREVLEQDQAALKTETTDADGKLTFSGLTPGLYLVYRSNSAKANKDFEMQPFLVAVPQTYPEGTVFDVTVSVKFSGPTEDPTPSNVPSTDPPKPDLPKTGQLIWPIPVLTLLGFGFLVLGLLFNRKKQIEQTELNSKKQVCQTEPLPVKRTVK